MSNEQIIEILKQFRKDNEGKLPYPMRQATAWIIGKLMKELK